MTNKMVCISKIQCGNTGSVYDSIDNNSTVVKRDRLGRIITLHDYQKSTYTAPDKLTRILSKPRNIINDYLYKTRHHNARKAMNYYKKRRIITNVFYNDSTNVISVSKCYSSGKIIKPIKRHTTFSIINRNKVRTRSSIPTKSISYSYTKNIVFIFLKYNSGNKLLYAFTDNERLYQ